MYWGLGRLGCKNISPCHFYTEEMVKAKMSLYEEATTKIRVGSGYLDEFPAKLVYIRDQYLHRFCLQL